MSRADVKPNFLIVGAAKAGTSSLHDWLSQHPQVFMPAHKEPCYFVEGWGVKHWPQYLELFRGGVGRRAVGEASAAYLAAAESPAWIRRTLGDVKIIVLLRDPSRRAVSLHQWMVAQGYEPILGLREALDAEAWRSSDEAFRRSAPQYWLDYLYFRSGLYALQLERYFETFGPASVMVLLFEEMIRRPGRTYAQVCDFLGVDAAFTPDFRVCNAARLPRYASGQHALMRLLRRGVGGAVGRSVWRGAMWCNLAAGRKPVVDAEVVSHLRDRFAGDVRRVGQLLEKDLSSWLCSTPSSTVSALAA